MIEQKNQEIAQLRKWEQSARNELEIRAEKIKANENMINDLLQQTQEQQQQLKQFTVKCESLEAELNKSREPKEGKVSCSVIVVIRI